MNFKTTWSLVTVAVVMFAFIFFLERPHRLTRAIGQSHLILPGFSPEAVTGFEIRPPGQPEIRLERTNGSWRLVKPLASPANRDRVEELLRELEQLNWQSHLTAEELKDRPLAQEELGFVSPQVSVSFEQRDHRRHLLFGAKTAIGDQVFAQVVGGDGYYLVQSSFLDFLPLQVAAWRDRTVFPGQLVTNDFVRVRLAARSFELGRDGLNRLWRVSPFVPDGEPSWSRADHERVEQLLKQFEQVQIMEFVSDDPGADLERYGLHAPEMELEFGAGGAVSTGLQAGRTVTNGTPRVYVRRPNLPGIFLIDPAALAAWRVPLSEFRDRNLVSLPAGGVDAIEVVGDDLFTLRLQADGKWTVTGGNSFPADRELVRELLRTLSTMKVELEKAVVTDFIPYGLESPLLQYTLRGPVTHGNGTNESVPIVHLNFGTNETEKVFLRRTDENSVHLVPHDFFRLPRASWQLRDRRIWNFESSEVVGVTISQQGQSRKLARHPRFGWTYENSEELPNSFAIEETLHRLGELRAIYWNARGEASLDAFGMKERDYRIAIELNGSGGTRLLTLDFGLQSEFGHPHAAVMLGEELHIFEFPFPLYFELIEPFLSIPPPSSAQLP
jgi:hypothetical protein